MWSTQEVDPLTKKSDVKVVKKALAELDKDVIPEKDIEEDA